MGSHIKNRLLERTPQDALLGNELSSSPREVRFSEQEFSTGITISNIKYHHLESQNDKLFILFMIS